MPTPNIAAQTNTVLQCAESAIPFHSPDGRRWVTLQRGARGVEVHPLPGPALRSLLVDDARRQLGFAPEPGAVNRALADLSTRADCCLDPRVRPVWLRTAATGDLAPETLALDLHNSQGEAVRITTDGWSIDTDPGTLFRHDPGMLPIPSPAKTGSLESLRNLLHLRNEPNWIRVQTWLIAALRPSLATRAPYPVLVVEGPPNSGKTVAAQLLRTLIDPRREPFNVDPAGESKMRADADCSWVLAYDRIGVISPRLNAAICGVSETTPIILTRPPAHPLPADLENRALRVSLAPIALEEMQSVGEIRRDFEQMRRALLGALCDAAAHALAHQWTAQARRPRLADAVMWAVAAFSFTEEQVQAALSPPEVQEFPWGEKSATAGSVGPTSGSPQKTP